MRTHKRHSRYSLGTITGGVDDGWGTETPAEWEARKTKAYNDYLAQQKSIGSIPKNTYGIADSDFKAILEATNNGADKAVFDTLIAREQKRTNATTAQYSTVKSAEQIAQEARDAKVTNFDKYAKAGGLINDFNTLFAQNTAEIKTNQEAVFAQDPKLASKFTFNQTSGVYEPKPEAEPAKDNTLLYAGIAGGVVVVGTLIYFITQKKK